MPQTNIIIPKAFEPARRRALLDQYFLLQRGYNEIAGMIDATPDKFGRARLGRHQAFYMAELGRLREEYREGVPFLALARCPFSGTILNHSFDPYGLDGLWWNYEAPVRPVESLPSSFFALTGAVRMVEKPLSAPFLAKPGPEAPFVVPRILEHPAMAAVVATLQIGNCPAWAIVYFAQYGPSAIEAINSWGANEYSVTAEDGRRGWSTRPETPTDFDFDLAPYIRHGKLSWIAPGDKSLTLRTAVDSCPYLGLPGRRSLTRIQDGAVWHPEPTSS